MFCYASLVQKFSPAHETRLNLYPVFFSDIFYLVAGGTSGVTSFDFFCDWSLNSPT